MGLGVSRFLAILSAAALLPAAGCGAGAPPGASGGAAATPTGSGGPTVEWAFTHQQPDRLLEGVIRGARRSLDIAIYSITKPSVVKAIADARHRGVAVRLITDAQEARGRSQGVALRILREAGVPVKVNTHPGLMHLKVTIADGAVATAGSFNYTTAASTENDEVLVVVRDPAVAAAWEREFEGMWNDAARFRDLP
jgi:phosphatidylserine/phosphatidylglycerophosphate/cardiolipin synthase-like enzyme